MYCMGKDGRKEIGDKAIEYVNKEFNYNDMIKKWDLSLEDTIMNWKSKYTRVEIYKLGD